MNETKITFAGKQREVESQNSRNCDRNVNDEREITDMSSAASQFPVKKKHSRFNGGLLKSLIPHATDAKASRTDNSAIYSDCGK